MTATSGTANRTAHLLALIEKNDDAFNPARLQAWR